MPGQTLTLTLALSSGPHQDHLAAALLEENILRRLIRFTPDLEILEPDGTGVLKSLKKYPFFRIANRIGWGVWRRLPVVNRRPPLPVIALSAVSDRIISRWIPASSVFQAPAGLLASFRKARQLGAACLIDTGTLHPAAWQREVEIDCDLAGLRPRDCERLRVPMQLRRHEREFEICDKVIVYSTAAWQSFQPFPYRDKAVVLHPGIDHRFFVPPPARSGKRVFRYCYVGRIEAAKGVHYLIEAWKKLALPNAELVLAGRVLPEMTNLHADRIRLSGILSPQGVAKLYQESDVFVFPSMNEGLSLALLQAMSSGLPAIACTNTGADDCIISGRHGLLVPGRNVDALANAIQWSYHHRDEVAAMGLSARASIEENFTLPHYANRLLTLYRSLPHPQSTHDTY